MARTNVASLPPSTGGTQVPSAPAPEHGPLGPMDNPEVRAAIHAAVQEELKLVAERRGLNESISAVREKVKARGINIKAYKAALSYYSMPDAHRKSFDTHMAIVRKAIDMPIQPALWEDDPSAAGATAEEARQQQGENQQAAD